MSYETSDLSLASYLKAKGNRVSCRKEGRQCFFIFDSGVEKMVDGYFNNNLVKVTDYVNAVQNLKTMMFNK